MVKEGLTKRQTEVLDFIHREFERVGYAPTVREIGQAVGLSSSASVHRILSTLEEKGYLHKDDLKSRTLKLSDKAISDLDISESKSEAAPANSPVPFSSVSLPLVGRVAAGEPILAEQNIEDTFVLPKDIVGDSSSFILRVQGDSMINVGIYSGDYVVVRECNSADNGDIVVALVDNGATVKRFFKEDGIIRLQPENDSMEPIYTDDCAVLGKVVALFRTLR